MGFSNALNWELIIDGQSVLLPFGGLKFTHRVSGFGISGIVTGQFEFDIYEPVIKDGQYKQGWFEYSTVQLSCKTNPLIKSRVYYIAKRSISKNVCHFTAYDIASDLEKEFDTTKLWQEAATDWIAYTVVLEALEKQCRFAKVAANYDGMTGIRFTREMLKGKTCRAVLEMISTAMCGIWCMHNNKLELICLNNKNAYYHSGICKEYAEIDYQGQQKITKLIAVNSRTGNVVEYPASGGEYGTVIKIESPFVAYTDGTEGTDGYVWDRIQGLEYQGWKCDKGLIDIAESYPVFSTVSSLFTFKGMSEDMPENTLLLANQIVFDVDASGIYFSGGADPLDEEQWNYDNYIQRQLDQKVEVDKPVGNATLSDDKGLTLKKFIDENSGRTSTYAAGEDSEIKEFGFEVCENGLTEYEGSLVSKIAPRSASINSDKTEAVVNYEDRSYRYSIRRDSAGNITDFKKEEVNDT